MIRRLSIRTRLVVLTSALILVIVASNLYLVRKLTGNTVALATTTESAAVVEQANDARIAFGEMRYWLTDLAVSQTPVARTNAASARDQANRYLDVLATRKPELVASARTRIADFEQAALAAVHAYAAGSQPAGHERLAEARDQGRKIDNLLASLAVELNVDAGAARSEIIDDVTTTKRLAAAVIALSILAGIFLTLLVVRSIATPLRRLIAAIDGLSAANTAAEIPPPGPDEIGVTARALALFRDSLRERDRLAAESDRQRRILAEAIATISEGFILYGTDDRIVLCNDHFHGILPGLADLIRPGVSFRQIVDATIERGLITLGSRSPEQWVEECLRLHRTSGGYVEYNFSGRWVRVSEHRTHDGGAVAIFTDITELKKRQNELEKAREQAEAANSTKSQFLANMSHELRTPLNAVIGYSEMLQEDAAEAGQDKIIPDLQKIESAGRHLLGLINDILDLSKIEAGKMDIVIEEVELAPLLEEVRSIIQPLAARNGNLLTIACPPSSGTLRTDRTKLKQVLLNLLSNASKFTREGRLDLLVERGDPAAGHAIRFIVSDTGIGMTEAQLGRLFQAFTQVDAATARKYGGTGLGLAISRHLCQALGGDIAATSQLGAGSAFTVTLPDGSALPVAPSPAEMPLVTGEVDGKTTILVVDDDSSAHDLLSAGLGREGYRLVHARDGDQALALARQIRPDAIILDVMMPHMDGWTVLTNLKADPDLCVIPVVMVTILADRSIGLSLGAAEFMTKPVDRHHLATTLRLLLHREGSILVVDDDAAMREITRHTLEKLGHSVAEAVNGRDALRWLGRNAPPALVLLDLMMPEMDGFEFLDDFRSVDQWHDIPVVVLTAKQLTVAEQERLAGRARQVIAKGTATDGDLAAVVEKAVRRRPVRQAELVSA